MLNGGFYMEINLKIKEKNCTVERQVLEDLKSFQSFFGDGQVFNYPLTTINGVIEGNVATITNGNIINHSNTGYGIIVMDTNLIKIEGDFSSALKDDYIETYNASLPNQKVAKVVEVKSDCILVENLGFTNEIVTGNLRIFRPVARPLDFVKVYDNIYKVSSITSSKAILNTTVGYFEGEISFSKRIIDYIYLESEKMTNVKLNGVNYYTNLMLIRGQFNSLIVESESYVVFSEVSK
jgi:hypothetical protein